MSVTTDPGLMPEARLTDELIAGMRARAGTDLRIDHSVNNRGHLVGVRSVVATTLAGRLPEADRLGRQRLCLIAFRGPYAAGEIPRAQPAGPGPYAIVAVDSNGSTVLASFVVDELPLRFRHRL